MSDTTTMKEPEAEIHAVTGTFYQLRIVHDGKVLSASPLGSKEDVDRMREKFEATLAARKAALSTDAPA